MAMIAINTAKDLKAGRTPRLIPAWIVFLFSCAGPGTVAMVLLSEFLRLSVIAAHPT